MRATTGCYFQTGFLAGMSSPRLREWKYGFLIFGLGLVGTSIRMFLKPQACRDSGVAPFAQAPLWAIRAIAVVTAMGGLFLLYLFLSA